MPYNMQRKILGIAGGNPSGTRPANFPGFDPRAPGARIGLMYPGVMRRPMVNRGMGDPGIFGAIGKAIGGFARSVVQSIPVVGGIEKGIEKGIAAFNTSRIGAPSSRSLPTAQNFTLPNIGPGMPNDFGSGIPPGNDPNGGGNSSGDTSIPADNVSILSGRKGTWLVPTSGNVCAHKGYHLNKSAYWRDDSVLLPGAHKVLPGTMCVKNRRMNPFNPRAASKAMHRLSSLAKGMKVLHKEIGKLARTAGVHHAAPRHFARARAK